MSSPTVQFMGGMDTIYNITFETTDYSVVQALEQCQIANDMITRNNGKIRSSVGFVKLELQSLHFSLYFPFLVPFFIILELPHIGQFPNNIEISIISDGL